MHLSLISKSPTHNQRLLSYTYVILYSHISTIDNYAYNNNVMRGQLVPKIRPASSVVDRRHFFGGKVTAIFGAKSPASV